MSYFIRSKKVLILCCNILFHHEKKYKFGDVDSLAAYNIN
jgi:hypothetical protein